MNEKRFYDYVEEMVGWFLEQMPVMATYMGVHNYDHLLGDFNIKNFEAFLGKAKEYLEELERLDSRDWSVEGKVDHTLVIHFLKGMIMEQEDRALHRRNPGFYLENILEGIFSLVIKDFAPLEKRFQSLWQRVAETPRVLKEARRNIQPEDVPVVWAEVALEQARMVPHLFRELLPSMAGEFPALKEKLEEAGEKAEEACRSFIAYLEEEVLPVAAGEFAAGEAHFNALLKERHMVSYDAEELLEAGWRLFNETRVQIESMGREIDPALTADEIIERDKEDHPAAHELLPAYRRAMEGAKSFTIEQGIASIPAGEILQIIETPEYLRLIIPYAAYVPPGIFEDKLEGYFMVTPPDKNASHQEQKEKLKGQPYSKIPVTALHEAYPGHHLQLAWSAREGSVARKLGMTLSTMFIEGWAFYCEELMEELGFIDTKAQKLGRLTDQLWRAARIILDVSLHCRGMGIQDAVDFLVKRCGLQPVDALAEVRRYTSYPTQPQSYLMGKLEILKIIDEYRKHFTGRSMREMHDDILACGSLPPKLLCQQLFS